MSDLDAAATALIGWRASALRWLHDLIPGVEIDEEWFLEFCAVLVDPKKRRIALKAAKGAGKTTALALAILWFLTTQHTPLYHPRGYVLSISRPTLKTTLWPELCSWIDRSPALSDEFAHSGERIYNKKFPQTWFVEARAWNKDADKQQQNLTLAGLHGKFTLIVVDESAGVPDSVFSATEGSLTSGIWNKIIQAGNSTHRNGPLWKACTSERSLWHLIEVTGDPDNPKRSKRISVEWCREQIVKYGIDNPWVRVNVFNEFPKSDFNALFAGEDLRAAMHRQIRPEDYEDAQKRLGCDPARFGDDRTIIVPRQGLQIFKWITLRGARATQVGDRMLLAKNRFGSELEFVDDGNGGGVIDFLLRQRANPIPVSFGGEADNKHEYKNKRAEIYFRMADWVLRGGGMPPMTDDDIAEFENVTYTYTERDQKILEPKEYIKATLGFSPDVADGCACTFGSPEMPRTDPILKLVQRATQRQVAAYDPLADADQAALKAFGAGNSLYDIPII